MEVDHQTFDWIFFAIVGIPLVLAFFEWARPDWLDSLVRERRDKRDVTLDRPRR